MPDVLTIGIIVASAVVWVVMGYLSNRHCTACAQKPAAEDHLVNAFRSALAIQSEQIGFLRSRNAELQRQLVECLSPGLPKRAESAPPAAPSPATPPSQEEHGDEGVEMPPL